MLDITPIILAGGTGTRLWPLSRKSYPKQFSNLFEGETLFQKSALRLQSSSILSFESLITVTASDYRFIVSEQLQSIGIDPGPILIEPTSKNTASAILAATIFAQKRNPDAILLVAPSDHLIPNHITFHETIFKGLNEVSNGNIMTFGVRPTRADTGYGYLEMSEVSKDGPVKVAHFHEKPNHKAAESMIKTNNFLWNAGIFMFQAKTMISAFQKFSPNLLKQVSEAIELGQPDLGFFRIDPDTWNECEDISIDYAIMERADNLMTIPFDGGWSDLGGWDAVWHEMGPDKDGVAVSKNAHAFDCKNTLLRSESSNQEIVGLGLKDIIAVAMSDAVLVAHKDQTQNLKMAISKLKKRKIKQVELFPKDYRPWGWFEILITDKKFQVKRIHVKPGAALSLQSHEHRSEHWVVVEGSARTTVKDEIKILSQGESIFIGIGDVHRLENPGKVPVVIIEVQTGTYLGEDDIIRYEDLYART